MLNKIFKSGPLLTLSVVLGVAAGYLGSPVINGIAEVSSDLFINLLKLVSLPIIFLSIVSTTVGMESMEEFKTLGKRILKYTLITTVIAATIALGLFLLIDPAQKSLVVDGASAAVQQNQTGYFTYLMTVIPSNFLEPFIKNNVIGVLFLALLFSLATLAIPDDQRKGLHTFFKSLYAVVMKVTSWIVKLMPIAIWAFITLFMKDLDGLEFHTIALYLTVVVLANLIQAFVVLPLFLKAKGIPPVKTLKGMMPALSVAFFSKSSSAALPAAVSCAEENVGVSRKIAGFSLPLCTTINMNACAAFILTTVLFVSMSNGVVFAPVELFAWIFIATIAAVGNAGVPMGCYFISSAFLVAMDVPLNILGVILPFYSLIDMLESAINVWSDSCVTVMVQQDVSQEDVLGEAVATS